jgi:hypothetical protein
MPLSKNLGVPLTLLSQLKFTFVYDLAPWFCSVIDTVESKLSGVIDTAKSKLSGVNDTAESKLSGIINTAESAQIPLSQFQKLEKALRSFK